MELQASSDVSETISAGSRPRRRRSGGAGRGTSRPRCEDNTIVFNARRLRRTTNQHRFGLLEVPVEAASPVLYMLRDDLVIMIFGVPEIVQFVINRGWLLSLDTAPRKNYPFSWGNPRLVAPSLIHCFLNPPESHPKGYVNRFIRFCKSRLADPILLSPKYDPQNCPSPGGSGPHLIHGFLVSYQSTSQTYVDRFSRFCKSRLAARTDSVQDSALRARVIAVRLHLDALGCLHREVRAFKRNQIYYARAV